LRPKTKAIRALTGYQLLNDTHTAWIEHCWENTNTSMVFPFLAARGSYKTSSIIIAGIFWKLIHDPDTEIILFRKTFDMAASVNKALVQLFETHRVPLAEATTHRLKLQEKTAASPMANVNAFGMGDSTTGTHADIIIADDIITLRDKVSEAERRRTIEFVNEFFRLRKTPQSRIIITGTRWHKQDAWHRIEQFAPPELWPIDRCPWLDAAALQTENSAQDWALNYLLEYPPDADSVFRDPQYEIFPPDAWRHKQVIMHIDAAYGGADTTACTITDGAHVLGRLWQGAYHNRLGEIADLYEQYHCRAAWCEDNDKGFLAADLRASRLSVNTYHETRHKEQKISATLKPSTWARLRFDPATDDEYLAQILDWTYNTKRHDDAPDSLACAIGICENHAAVNLVKREATI